MTSAATPLGIRDEIERLGWKQFVGPGEVRHVRCDGPDARSILADLNAGREGDPYSMMAVSDVLAAAMGLGTGREDG